jgi:hypothetical protein
LDSEQIIRSLPTFTVSSAGAPDAIAPLTLQAAEQTLPLLARLAAELGHKPLQPLDVLSFAVNDAARSSAARLKELFDAYGSDKASHHNYHHLYGNILHNPAAVTAIFEIGLGTNNVDVVSNMGPGGRPGSSLRAFRDHLPNAQVYGADIDRRILFTEERITTFFVDQTDPNGIEELSARLPAEFDLIIDDGLHAPNANLFTLIFSLKKLKLGGVLVVEDVHPAHFPVWQTVAAVLPQARYVCFLVLAAAGCMVAIQRMS